MASAGSSQDQSTSGVNTQQLAALSKILGRLNVSLSESAEGFRGLPAQGAQLAGQSQGIVDQLGGAGSGLEQFIGQGTTDQQISGVTGVVQNFLDQNLSGASGLGTQANILGGFGGGRQGVESGAAIGQAATGLGGITSQILGQDIQRRQQAAGQQGQQQLAGQGLQLGGLQSIFDLLSGGLLGSFGGLQQGRGIIGGLGQQSQADQSSRSFGIFGG